MAGGRWEGGGRGGAACSTMVPGRHRYGEGIRGNVGHRRVRQAPEHRRQA